MIKLIRNIKMHKLFNDFELEKLKKFSEDVFEATGWRKEILLPGYGFYSKTLILYTKTGTKFIVKVFLRHKLIVILKDSKEIESAYLVQGQDVYNKILKLIL